jgi:folate-binding protein YgfZ
MTTIILPDFDRLHRLRGGAVAVPAPLTVLRVAGPGALTCLQGLWTNDLLEPGDGTLTYGALLTPKGMIIADGWALRTGEKVDLLFALEAREPVTQVLRRSLPPRLASVTDLTGATGVLQLVGDAVLERWPVLPLGRLPEAGGIARAECPAGAFDVATPVAGPFAAVLLGEPEVLAAVETLLDAAGMARGGDADREAARILSGWPALGAEIDERTLPQEVRFDEHGGVSYTKGCYTGQETVARLHFRGHANRTLRGLHWLTDPVGGDTVMAGEKSVGRVTSILRLPDRTLGLAILRRELHPGNQVSAGGAAARVAELPFGPDEVEG